MPDLNRPSFILHLGRGLYSNKLTVYLLLLAGLLFFQARAQLSRDNLFPFGTGAGDTALSGNDDNSSLPICSNVSYSFYDRKISCYFVSFFCFEYSLLLSNSIISYNCLGYYYYYYNHRYYRLRTRDWKRGHVRA